MHRIKRARSLGLAWHTLYTNSTITSCKISLNVFTLNKKKHELIAAIKTDCSQTSLFAYVELFDTKQTYHYTSCPKFNKVYIYTYFLVANGLR